MITIMTAATARGSQPPCGTLTRLATRKAQSMTKKRLVNAPTSNGDHFQRRRATTAKRMVVITMVEVTATPKAAARLLDVRKEMTMSRQAPIKAQLTKGM